MQPLRIPPFRTMSSSGPTGGARSLPVSPAPLPSVAQLQLRIQVSEKASIAVEIV